MLSFNYQAPIYTFMTLVDNINYLYEDVSVEQLKTNTDENADALIASNHIKKRILTYYRNEILVIPTHSIAYMFIENAITYVVNMEGKKSIANESLDHLFTGLNSKLFFRANKEFIIRISAIKKIIKMGNDLKIETHPSSDNAIIIKENKVKAFKKWLQD